ncbi:zf-HC2 domain-containing protein [Desulfoscipio geothermicus]|uniref:Anti-sigma-W factor RsiW n=1 Tax=Desulfoscipio geothermicus DSM 3669 TaxID=1121426 RepID=A0A1I6CXE8_9FIRM|nr:zf-HC2 domain-containing protein [Desulfoscipio geothermicus]SFQ97840.1 protein of unknown function [Desulfoscipio geothermicus DSM 3669]
MNCSQVKKLIPEWLDGELEHVQSMTVKDHVAACRDCRAEADFWRELGATLRGGMEDIKAPPGFAAGVMAQLPKQHGSTARHSLFDRWKRSVAVAATFLLVAVGSAGAYMNWGGNIVTRVADNNPRQVIKPPVEQPGDINIPNTGPQQSGEAGSPVEQSGSGGTEQGAAPGPDGNNARGTGGNSESTQHTPSGNGTAQPAAPDGAGGSTPDAAVNAGQYALLNIEKDRVVERTLLKINVGDLDAAHGQALALINETGAAYEVLGTENAPTGSRETLKITVSSSLSGKLMAGLKTLGQVVTADTQREDINARYNEKVEQYLSLKAQLQGASAVEREQLQVKMAGIEAQLRSWDREADTDTIILWLEG